MDQPGESLEELKALNERYHRLLISTMQAEVGNYPFLRKRYGDYRTGLLIEASVRFLIVFLITMLVASKTDFRWGIILLGLALLLYLIVELLEIIGKLSLARQAMYK